MWMEGIGAGEGVGVVEMGGLEGFLGVEGG